MLNELKGCYLLKLEAEKVLRVVNSEGLVIPLYLGQLIDYFVNNVRGILRPRNKVLALWVISKSGTPMGTFLCF